MKRVLGPLVMMAALATAVPAAAQSASDVPEGPIVNSWYLGANSGVAVVEKFGGVVGLEGGLRVWKNLDLVGELVWVQNAVTRKQLDQVGQLATALSQSQNASASGSIEVPVKFGGLGARWVFESGRVRPYVLATVGGARVNRNPSFSLNGADVTGSISQYGVTLGEDVIGKFNQVATSGGIGMVMGFGTFYLDGGVRMLRVSGNGANANIARIVIGGGYRF
jgi:hypothetical protein